MEPVRLFPFCGEVCIPMTAAEAATEDLSIQERRKVCTEHLLKVGTRIRSIRTQRVTASEPDISEVCSVYSMCIVTTCMSLLVLAPGSATPKKLPLIFNVITSSLPPGCDSQCQGMLLQRCLDKQIAGSLTLLIQTWWHGPIHCCLPADVLE